MTPADSARVGCPVARRVQVVVSPVGSKAANSSVPAAVDFRGLNPAVVAPSAQVDCQVPVQVHPAVPAGYPASPVVVNRVGSVPAARADCQEVSPAVVAPLVLVVCRVQVRDRLAAPVADCLANRVVLLAVGCQVDSQVVHVLVDCQVANPVALLRVAGRVRVVDCPVGSQAVAVPVDYPVPDPDRLHVRAD